MTIETPDPESVTPAVTVVISTYNRSELLEPCVRSALHQEPVDATCEVIVVDNNSTDDTAGVVRRLMAGYPRLRYVFEGRQGLSHARNAGIAAARAPIIAFTDDDVRAAPDWVARIRAAFDEHPEIDYLGGRVLPRWPGPPPPWLSPAHWAPLALVDHGDTAFYCSSHRPICLVGACLAFRTGVFDRIGLFKPQFQRVKDGIGSTEDHELLLRIWRAGGVGLYRPDVVVTAEVQEERMTKAYHRRWHAGHGRFAAAMHRTGGAHAERRAAGREPDPHLFGSPGYRYRQVLARGWGWLRATLARRSDEAFLHETALRHTVSEIRADAAAWRTSRERSSPAELARFMWAMTRRKLRPWEAVRSPRSAGGGDRSDRDACHRQAPRDA